jgi:hypothetical protein
MQKVRLQKKNIYYRNNYISENIGTLVCEESNERMDEHVKAEPIGNFSIRKFLAFFNLQPKQQFNQI